MNTACRLAAILAADVVGYSRLMERDEAGTLAALKERRKAVLEPLVARHQGRVFKVAGDGVLVEFASAVNAVQCAVELQQAMAAANGEQPDDRRIVLRVGVNLGDVMVEGGDLYGDGVNIAARLESLAEPGGILVSGTAHDYVRNKVKVGFDDLGTQALKNIAEPVRAYRVTGTPVVTITPHKATTDKPSIAVLPFTNMSGDPEQEYFSDGITEDIITELSRFRTLSVIARKTSFQFRGSQRDIRRIGQAVAARYVVEGSVRKAGERIRVTAQLIDTSTGAHVWAQRYDRKLIDLFAVQDDVTRCIVGAATTRLEEDYLRRLERRPTESLQAYDYCLRGRECIKQASAEGMAEARRYFELAIEADPLYARAYSGLAYVCNMSTSYSGWGIPFDDAYAQAFEFAKKAVVLDDTDNMPHITLGWVLMWRGNYVESRREFDRALELNPSDADALVYRAHHLIYTGEAEQAIETVQRAIHLNPLRPHSYMVVLRGAYLLARRCKEAIAAGEGVPDSWPEAPIMMAVAYAYDGQLEKAKAAADRFVSNIRAIWAGDPSAGPAEYVKWWLCDNPYQFQADIDYLLAGVRKAGLPG